MTETSIGNSNGSNAIRGLIVVAIAIGIGVFLMNRGLESEETAAGDVSAETETGTDDTGDGGDTDSTTTTAAPSTTEPTAEVRPPAEVSVIVLNGARVAGVAAKGTALLETFSYNMLEPGNTDAEAPTSAILYTGDAKADAEAVAEVFGIDPATYVAEMTADNQPAAELPTADVIVVIGQDDAITFS